MALFGHLAGRRTVGRNAAHPPANYIVGRYDPSRPSITFESPRYGVSDRTAPTPEHPAGEQLTTGYVYGQEGTSLLGLQDAIRHGAFAGAPWNIPAGSQALATEADYFDSLMLEGNTPGSSVYFSIVKADADAHADPMTTPPLLPPPPPPIVATSKLSPLSPASVRVEELRVYGCVVLGTVKALQGGSPLYDAVRRLPQGENESWLSLKPFAVEILRFYRRIRAIKFDTREIPQEDR